MWIFYWAPVKLLGVIYYYFFVGFVIVVFCTMHLYMHRILSSPEKTRLRIDTKYQKRKNRGGAVTAVLFLLLIPRLLQAHIVHLKKKTTTTSELLFSWRKGLFTSGKAKRWQLVGNWEMLIVDSKYVIMARTVLVAFLSRRYRAPCCCCC